jgi:hypothetical protein
MSYTGIVVSDVATTRWGGFLPMCHATVTWPRIGWRVVPLGGATRRGDVNEVGLRISPLCGALSLLHHCDF